MDQIKRRSAVPVTTEDRAAKVMDAICELMAAHELVWRNGASIEGAKLVKEKAAKLLADALAHGGCLAD